MPSHGLLSARGQRGAALLELALILPLFVAVIYGVWGVALAARARWQLATVAHAVMREVAAGTLDPWTLKGLAQSYAEADPGRFSALTVEVAPEDLGLGASGGLAGLVASWLSDLVTGVRVTVTASYRLTGPLRRVFPEGVHMSYSNTVLVDPWKYPIARLASVIGLPSF